VTGPEHYKEAERLLELATSRDDELFVRKAQVHATLAAASAGVLAQLVEDAERPWKYRQEWAGVAQ
jgi:hypothetical protein